MEAEIKSQRSQIKDQKSNKMYKEFQEKTILDLGSVENIPVGEGRDFKIGSEEIAVFRARNNKIYAVQSKCPHRNGALADGLIGDGVLVCPFHSYKFDLASGKPLGNGCHSLRTYEVEISKEGRILLRSEMFLEEMSGI
jgi:nitrite reductase (NADH) small subunit